MKAAMAQIDVLIAIISFSAFFTMAEYTVLSGGAAARGASLALATNLYRMAEVQNLVHYGYSANASMTALKTVAQKINASVFEVAQYGQGYNGGRMVAMGNAIYVIGGVQ